MHRHRLSIVTVTVTVLLVSLTSTLASDRPSDGATQASDRVSPRRRILQEELLDETPNMRLQELRLRMQMQQQGGSLRSRKGSAGGRAQRRRGEEEEEEERGAATQQQRQNGDVEPATVSGSTAGISWSMGPTDTPTQKRARRAKALRALEAFPQFNLTSPIVGQYAEIVDSYLAPWGPVEGVTDGLGNGRGMISPQILASMAVNPGFMSCCVHVKIVSGKLFYRYGGYLWYWYRNRRAILTLKTIQTAIRRYGLTSLSAELFVSVCDEPISYDSSLTILRAGYPVLSTEFIGGSVDILFPDPLDLSESYMKQSPNSVPWAKRQSKAVFRGSTTNYELHNDTNWRASPRLRLHMMSDVRPDLLDAKLTRWSHSKLKSTIRGMVQDGVRLGKSMDRDSLEGFKYELVVDGGGGSCRTCGVLVSRRTMIRQASAYSQFFQPLLVPYVHFVPTKHYWEDLYTQVEWAQKHDDQARQMVKNANELAQWACTWEGRTLYWAILLAKYSKEAMEAPEAVEQPEELCFHPFPWQMMNPEPPQVRMEAFPLSPKWPPGCGSAQERTIPQPQCTHFCKGGSMAGGPQVWLSQKSLSHIKFEDF